MPSNLDSAPSQQGGEADTAHIAKVLSVTLGFLSEATADFHTLLYTTQVESMSVYSNK